MLTFRTSLFMALKKYIVYMALIGLYFINESVGYAVANCKTSHQCVPVYNCKSLVCLSANEDTALEEEKLLSGSTCELNSSCLKFCCPTEDVINSTTQMNTCPNVLEERRILPTQHECGKIGLDFRIFGGSETEIQEFPWNAILMYTNETNPGYFYMGCGGSLINHYYVLTAAHCVDTSLSTVRLGEWNLRTERDFIEQNNVSPIYAPPHQDISIEKQIIHPHYNVGYAFNNDIALLRLKSKVDYTHFISPICLPLDVTQQMRRYEGTVAEIAGWGQTEKGIVSEIKLKASVTIINNDKCKREYLLSKTIISENRMCAIGNKMDAGEGDSGGALIVKDTINGKMSFYLAGVISGGECYGATGNCTYENTVRIGIYVHVGAYMKWITDSLGQ